VENIGEATAEGGFLLFVVVDGQPLPNSPIIHTEDLPADSFFDIFVEVTMEGDSDAIQVCVSPAEGVMESNTENNCDYNTLEMPLPDLIVNYKVEPWVEGEEGIRYHVYFTIKNIGLVTAKCSETPVTIRLYIDDMDNPVEGDIAVFDEDLAPGETSGQLYIGIHDFTEPSDTVKLCVDTTEALAEENETNNCLTNTKTLKADIRIEPPTQVVGVNQIFAVQIWVDTRLQEVDTLDLFLDFDTAYLVVVDAEGNPITLDEDAINSGAIVLGENADIYFNDKNLKKIDNTGATGMVDLSLGIGTEGFPVAGEDLLVATIRFKALQITDPDVTPILFHTEAGLRKTAAIREVDVTGNISNGEVMVIEGVPATLTVNLEGRPAAPNAQWIIPVRVWVHNPGDPWDNEDADTVPNGAVLYIETWTDNQGRIQVTLPPGTWDLRVKGKTTLKVIKRNVVATLGMGAVSMGTLYEGDTDDNNVVDGRDYSTVVLCYQTYTDHEPTLPQSQFCDFNNDGVVMGEDYSRLLANFLKKGADIP
jgi:hypothetical protein